MSDANTVLGDFDTGYRYTRWMYLESTQEEDALLREKLQSKLDAPYRVTHDNCATAVASAETEIGNIPKHFIFQHLPKRVFEHIHGKALEKNILKYYKSF